jgi:AraC family transcriptional regulator
MMRHIKPTLGEGSFKKEIDVESTLSWQSGSALMKTQAADSSCQRDFIREDLAVGILFQNPGSEVTWHLDGKLVLDKSWSPKTASHDLVVLPTGCEFHAQCQGSGQGLWLFLDPASITSDARVQSFIKRTTVDYSWSKDRLAWMVASEIRKECKNGFPRGAMFLESASMIFVTQLAYVLDEAVPHLEPTRALSDNKLEAVIDYIGSNLDRNITLSELSALVQLTPRYFCGAFKQAIGKPPHQYLIEQRVERARMMLVDPSLSLTEVALIVGFSSQSHLNDHFRRIVGISPSRYRSEIHVHAVKKPLD